MTKTSKLFIECDSKDKAQWMQAARAAGGTGKLDQWVIDTLNAAASQLDIPPPSWMTFSPRTCQALVAARITKPDELVDVINQQGLYLINNIGPAQVGEIIQWHKNSIIAESR